MIFLEVFSDKVISSLVSGRGEADDSAVII